MLKCPSGCRLAQNCAIEHRLQLLWGPPPRLSSLQGLTVLAPQRPLALARSLEVRRCSPSWLSQLFYELAPEGLTPPSRLRPMRAARTWEGTGERYGPAALVSRFATLHTQSERQEYSSSVR
jgi:hypothetical protein